MHISQRDMAERGHSLESIKASIRARKPDFDAYIGMQSMYFVPYLLPAQCLHAGIIEIFSARLSPAEMCIVHAFVLCVQIHRSSMQML